METFAGTNPYSGDKLHSQAPTQLFIQQATNSWVDEVRGNSIHHYLNFNSKPIIELLVSICHFYVLQAEMYYKLKCTTS